MSCSIRRVLCWAGAFAHCPVAAIHLRRALPHASSSLPVRSAGTTSTRTAWPCSKWGLPCRIRRRLRGELLPRLFTLTESQKTRRYFFCGTFLRVAPSGCYPPLVPAEPGRSSYIKCIRTRLPEQLIHAQSYTTSGVSILAKLIAVDNLTSWHNATLKTTFYCRDGEFASIVDPCNRI